MSKTGMYDNRGKYFDAYLFNKEFDEYIQKQDKKRLYEQELKTTDLNNIVNKSNKNKVFGNNLPNFN